MCMPHFVYASIDAHSVCFHPLDVVTNASVNVDVQIFGQVTLSIILGMYQRQNINLGILNFLRIEKSGFKSGSSQSSRQKGAPRS